MSVGLNFGQMVKSSLDSVSNDGARIQQKMDDIMSKEEVSPEDLLDMQYQMGIFTTKLEVTGSMSKSIIDMLKAFGQRTG